MAEKQTNRPSSPSQPNEPLSSATIGAYVGLSMGALLSLGELQVSPAHVRTAAELDGANRGEVHALTNLVDSLVRIGIAAVSASVKEAERRRLTSPIKEAPVHTAPDPGSLPTEPVKSRRSATPLPTEGFWTIDHVAAFLKLSPKTIRNWRVHGKGPKATVIGGQLRWNREGVERWVAEQQG